jgi:prepilin-type N-terminal cleavage/methylation domain-containing protein
VRSLNRIRSIQLFTQGRRQEAFTLIELLVVIAIIAVLIGLLFPAFRAVQDQAKRTQAKNDLTQIVNAVNAFYTEYGKYPVPSGTDYMYGPSGNATNAALFNELRSASNALNTRQIVFISPPYVKDPANPRSGIGTAAANTGQYFDPWGRAYNVEIDADYTNKIEANPYAADTGAGPAALTIGAIAWSGGKDGKAPPEAGATTNFNNSDDVISWQ